MSRRDRSSVGLSAAELSAASDSRPGVLLASGYIAGGALAGIVIAFMAGVLTDFDRAIGVWAGQYNPLFAGPQADALSLLPFALLVAMLFWVGREPAATRC